MSTSESKKNSSKKEQQADAIPVDEVHTANNWESADLGDDQRKQKFLRLMGAKKRKDEIHTERQNSRGSNHEDDFIPEKKHYRTQAENETINRELEQQFNESLQSKIHHTYHGGLGFHGDNTSASSSNDGQHQLTKTKFIPAKTEAGSTIDHVKVEEQLNDKQEKKKKLSVDDQTDRVEDKPEKKKKSSSNDQTDKVEDKSEKKKKSSTDDQTGKVEDQSNDKQGKKKKSKS